jgi:hypothetical protein
MDYQKAKDIREKSFSDMMVKSLTQGDGIRESFSKTISEKTQARVKGFKQAFDPMQIAKTLTFGSNIAPALLGSLTGRSSKDIKFFSGKKRKSKADFSGLDNSVSGVSKDTDGSKKIIEVLGLIYRELDRAEEDRKTEESENKTNQKIEEAKDEEYENDRNAELVRALTSRIKPKKGKKRETYRDEKGRFAKKPTTPTIPEVPFKAPPITPPKVPEVPKVPPPKVPEVPKTPPKPTAPPKVPTKPSQIVPPIVKGAAVSVGLVPLLAKGESTNYNQLVKSNQGDLTGKFNTKPLVEMTIAEVLELQRNMINSKKFPSSAVGKYQIITATLKEGVEQLKIPLSEKFDETTQDRLYREFLTGGKKGRESLNAYLKGDVPDTPENLAAAQLDMAKEFASFAVPYKVWRPENRDKNGKIIWDARWIQAGQSYYTGSAGNKAHITPQQSARGLIEERQLRLNPQNQSSPDTKITPQADINNLSKENANLKDGLNKDKPSQIEMNNSQSSSTQNNQQKLEESVDDRPAIIKKGRK